INAARFRLSEMDLAGFLSEFVADIIGVFACLLGQLSELRQSLALLFTHRQRNRLLFAPGRHGWSHQRLLDLCRVADWTSNEAPLFLSVKVFAVAEPAFEFVFRVANERET